jgi:hypothetical protein
VEEVAGEAERHDLKWPRVDILTLVFSAASP